MPLNRKAIATLAIGSRYRDLFERLCRPNWTRYAERHGYDLVVFDRPLDGSARAQARSPAWQKCLILEQPEITAYERVVWLDADILINPDAPCACAGVPLGKIGAVDAYGTPSRAVYRDILERQYARWRARGVRFVENPTPETFYRAWGLPGAPEGDADAVAQTGVLVLSPGHHRALLRHVYDAYDDKGGAEWNYEMRPLSYEIVKANLAAWLDGRFNMVVSDVFAWQYPFLADNIFRPLEASNPKEVTMHLNRLLLTACLKTALANAYFLHFAGQQSLMPLLAESS